MSNKFTTFLQKLGADFKLGVQKTLQVEAKLLPAEEAVAGAVSIVNPVAGATLQEILTPIVQVEQVATAVGASSGTGQQKLAAALPQFEQVLASDPIFKGKVPADLDKYNQSVEALAGAFANLLNSYSA